MHTPDGRNYDFQAVGEFIAAKDESGDLEIQVRQEPWGSSTTVSVNTAIAMGQDPPLFVNAQPTELDGRGTNLPHGGQIEQNGDEYTMIWPDQTRVSVTLRGSYFDVHFLHLPRSQ